jgi:dTDP-glucose pyrophosphorylase
MLNKITIKETDKLKDVLLKMKKNSLKCIVVSKENKLLGTLSDGDIRKAILKGFSIEKEIKKIYNKNCKYFFQNQVTDYEIQKILQKNRYDVIPLVDSKKKIIKIFTFNNNIGKPRFKKIKNVEAVIMAGGKGTRLKPFTDVLPKCLVPINDKTILEKILEKFNKYSIVDFSVIVNFKSKIIEAYFKDVKLKKELNFIKENIFLGTAGGLKLIENRIKSDFFFTNCDVLLDIDYHEFYLFHKKNKFDLSVVIVPKPFKFPYGSVETLNHNLIKINEKPELKFLINTGMYLINPKILNIIPKNVKYDFDTLIKDCKKKNFKVGAYIAKEKSWLDIGEWDHYKSTLKKLKI